VCVCDLYLDLVLSTYDKTNENTSVRVVQYVVLTNRYVFLSEVVVVVSLAFAAIANYIVKSCACLSM